MLGELSELVRRVADATIDRDMENEDWEKGTAINGLLTLQDDWYVETARELVDRSIDTQTADGKFNYDDPKPWMHGEAPHRAQCEPATIGHGTLEFYDRTGDNQYLEACHRQFEYLTSKAQRTNDGGIAYSPEPVELWVDSIYMICPFFARYGRLTDPPEAFAKQCCTSNLVQVPPRPADRIVPTRVARDSEHIPRKFSLGAWKRVGRRGDRRYPPVLAERPRRA